MPQKAVFRLFLILHRSLFQWRGRRRRLLYMKVKTLIGFVIALISVLGINFIPLEMWLFRDFSGESAMFFYALENVAAIALATVFVLLFAPKEEVNSDYGRMEKDAAKKSLFSITKIRKRSEILQAYLVFSIGFSLGSIVLMCAFVFLVLKTQIQFEAVMTGLVWIFGFQILEFFGDFLMLRPLTLAQTEVFLKRSMGRVALLFLAVFVGFFLAAVADRWFVVPFVVLKTYVDIVEQVQIFRGLRTK